MWYVYVLINENDELYFGCTKDLKRRIKEHNLNRSRATAQHRWKLVYYEAYATSEDAFKREQRIKSHGQAKRHLKDRIARSLAKLSAG